jgi:hypothetical protein
MFRQRKFQAFPKLTVQAEMRPLLRKRWSRLTWLARHG